jgi:uncharacterized protein (DUF885 family)/membrane-bound inhibitor of C-type lysozyme
MLGLAALAACHKAPEQPAVSSALEQPAEESWDGFVERYIEEHLAAHPQFAVVQGRHEYDGQLPDWSRAGIEAEIARMHAARDAAMAFPDAALSDQQRYQREYLVAWLDHDLFWVEKARWPFRNPQFYLGWLNDSLDPAPYITLDYAPIEQRMAAFTRYLENIPGAAEQIRDNLEMPMPLTWLQLGIDAFSGYATYFENDVPAIWAEVRDETLQATFAEANKAAVAAMSELAAWLEANRDTATDQYALGPELYRQMLWDTERVDISLEELEAIGRADMQRNLDALRAACADFAPGESIPDCFARMSERKPENGQVLSAREQLGEIKEFMVGQDLVSIPGTEEALVEEAPPYARSNSAYINIPGPWEKDQPSVYYISPPNPEWPEDVQADYIPGEADLLFTSVHEVWPGHFLNFLHAKRSPWIFGRAFVGYAYSEGWAHYTEEMMLEAGLRGADPETRIGQLSNALLRNARFLSSIGLHTQGWSVQQSKRFFIDEGFQSEGTAIQQAARGTYDPGYLNYTMGKLLIMQLREDWVATRGGRKAWKAFHDEFLSYGGPPIPLVRQQMMGEPEPRAVFPGFLATGDGAQPARERRSHAWDCDDGQYLVTSQVDDSLWAFLPQGTVELAPVRSGSGAKYESDAVLFWNKGDEALLEVNGKSVRCVVNRRETPFEDAKLRGADFRGLGNEPGWTLELFSDGPSMLSTDYGNRQVEFLAGGPEDLPESSGSVFHGNSGETEVIVELRLGPCRDSMADAVYETAVTVRLGDRVLEGCGKALH